MLTRTQKDDLRFVRDCLLANGDRMSETLSLIHIYEPTRPY